MKTLGAMTILLISMIIVFGLFLVFTNAVPIPDIFLKDRLERRITKQVRNKCSLGEECLLDLKTVTGFEWDELFIFYDSYKFYDSYEPYQDVIRKVTNSNTDCHKKSGNVFGELWVFFHNNKEVKCLEIYASPFDGKTGIVFIFNKDHQQNKFYKVANNSHFLFSVKEDQIVIFGN